MVRSASEAAEWLRARAISYPVVGTWIDGEVDDDSIPIMAFTSFADERPEGFLIAAGSLPDALHELRHHVTKYDRVTLVMLGSGARLDTTDQYEAAVVGGLDPASFNSKLLVIFHVERTGEVTNALLWDEHGIEIPDTPRMSVENLAALYTMFS